MRVFRDLKPYICTFSECSLELVQFSTRAQWADHEFSCHRFVEDWGCPFCSTKDIQDRQGCEQHLERSHGIQHRELAYWANRARTQRARMMNVEECLLCRTFPAESRQAFIKHCCRHMEEIALMAMPQIADAGSEGDDNSDVERSTRSSGHSAYISSSNDAQPSRRDANAPIVAPMKHTGSTMNESPSTVIPSASNPVIGDEGRPRIDPTPELLGGFQTEQERAMVKSESATHKCSICDKRYKREYYYKKHMETHNPQRTYPYPCTAMNGDQQCTKKFQRKRYLDRHHESVHFKASAPTTSQPPPGALGSGHQSPHGEATYFDTTLTRDKLQLPPGKKRKEKTQADPAGIPGQSAPRPRAQDHRCGLCGNRFNRQDTLREYVLSPILTCSTCAN